MAPRVALRLLQLSQGRGKTCIGVRDEGPRPRQMGLRLQGKSQGSQADKDDSEP